VRREGKMKEQKNKGRALVIIIIIALVVVLVLAGVGVFMFLQAKKAEQERIQANEIAESQAQAERENVLSGMLFTDTYKHNGITLQKDEMGVYSITGLKDKERQTEINETIQQILQDMQQTEQVSKESLQVALTGNYADVVSFVFFGTKQTDPTKRVIQTWNYALKTGEEVHFSDIFSSKNAASEVYSDKLYGRLMKAIYGSYEEPEEVPTTVQDTQFTNTVGDTNTTSMDSTNTTNTIGVDLTNANNTTNTNSNTSDIWVVEDGVPMGNTTSNTNTQNTVTGTEPVRTAPKNAQVEALENRLIEAYEDGEEPVFYFDENEITICVPNTITGEGVVAGNDLELVIYMPDYTDQISIYKRFISDENLYDEEVEKEEPVYCTLREYDVFERISDHVYLAVYGPEATGYTNKEIADRMLENEKKIIAEEAYQFSRNIGSEFAIYAVNMEMAGNGSQVIVYRSATYIDASYFQSTDLSIGITKMWDADFENRGYEIPDEKIMRRDIKVMDKRYDENGIQISQVDYEIETENGGYVYIRRNADGTVAGRFKMQYGEGNIIEFVTI